MGLEAVKEEILGNAKEQANSLLAEGRREASRLIKDAEKKIEEIKSKAEEATKKSCEIIKRQELASADLEIKKITSETKKQIIENLFAEVRRKLESLDDKKRDGYLKKLIERAKKDIEVSFVYCNKKDSKFLKGINPEEINIIGGIIAENKDRTIRVDYTFESMLQSIKENELQNMNKITFG